MTLLTQLEEVADDQARETYRRILVDALTQQAERYNAKARSLREVNVQKQSTFIDGQIAEYRAMAATATRIRDEIKEG